jgi:hypothetical protein
MMVRFSDWQRGKSGEMENSIIYKMKIFFKALALSPWIDLRAGYLISSG